ncbi:phosphoribosyl-dephospho-CoA transferase [Paraburkholderia caballeronis]|uniref:malonate decarboxylase holo-ACP synthase n=1 Tax=Paraburkholderia caballeronis TaxID=416943 RepID=UPI001065EDB7|nr:malonate decarboxylase holo-ACP synthase [Paraburkholderia caballeronis]TDV26774.1 phosphoribosyl-dephospho-CoA transferase [Paraburkholderia caballeronis]
MHARTTPPFDADAPLSCDPRWRAHDLLRVARWPNEVDTPDWLHEAFARAPFAVVRRERAASGFVAVGFRGATRAQRFGTWVAADAIEAAWSPEDLVAVEALDGRIALPAFAALAKLRDTRSALHEFAWGPTGSAGFELAARVHAATGSSDLDLLIRMPQRCETATLRALADTLTQTSSLVQTRIDAQLETPSGGVALAELAAGKPRVLARAADGARLVADPWQTA